MEQVKYSQAADILTGEVTGLPDGLIVMSERKDGVKNDSEV